MKLTDERTFIMSSKAVEIERNLARGEMFLNRAGRARITLWVMLAVGGIGLGIMVHYIKGLCPDCGQSLNQFNCQCQREMNEPRWSTLGALLEKP